MVGYGCVAQFVGGALGNLVPASAYRIQSVTVNRGAGRDPAASHRVVAGGEDAGYGCAVVLIGREYPAIFLGGRTPGHVEVVAEVLVLVVNALVDYSDYDALTQVALSPYRFHVDVFGVAAPVVELALAPVKRVVEVGFYRRTAVKEVSVGGICVPKCGVASIRFQGVWKVVEKVFFIAVDEAEIVRAGFQVVPIPRVIVVPFASAPHAGSFAVEQGGGGDVHSRFARTLGCADYNVPFVGFGYFQLEVVHVGHRVNPAPFSC